MPSYASYTDEQLTDFLRSGDHAAFIEIYNRYWELLIDAAYQRLKSVEAAEEVVQEIFVSFYLRKEDFKSRPILEPYFRTALKYKVFHIYRSQQVYYNHLDSLIKESNIAPVMPDEILELKELREKINQIGDHLPEKCRDVFIMSRLEQLKHQEIADQLNISVSTVKKHLHKAMKILRSEFKGSRFDLLFLAVFLFLHK